MATLSYHEQKDIENIKKLGSFRKNFHLSALTSSAGSKRARPHGPGLPMHMI